MGDSGPVGFDQSEMSHICQIGSEGGWKLAKTVTNLASGFIRTMLECGNLAVFGIVHGYYNKNNNKQEREPWVLNNWNSTSMNSQRRK